MRDPDYIPWADGQRVELLGLRRRADLNGQRGVVVGFFPTRGRYGVSLESTEFCHVRAQNLRPLDPLMPRLPSGRALGRRGFIAAIAGGDAATVHRYLEAGADPDDVEKGFPMIAGATQNGHAEVVRVLAQAGANLEATTNYGATALHIAAQWGHAPCVEALLQRARTCGANFRLVHAQTNNGASALALAAEHGNTDCCRLLLRAGADPAYAYTRPSARLYKGARPMTALEWAEKGFHTETVALLRAATPLRTFALVIQPFIGGEEAAIELENVTAELGVGELRELIRDKMKSAPEPDQQRLFVIEGGRQEPLEDETLSIGAYRVGPGVTLHLAMQDAAAAAARRAARVQARAQAKEASSSAAARWAKHKALLKKLILIGKLLAGAWAGLVVVRRSARVLPANKGLRRLGRSLRLIAGAYMICFVSCVVIVPPDLDPWDRFRTSPRTHRVGRVLRSWGLTFGRVMWNVTGLAASATATVLMAALSFDDRLLAGNLLVGVMIASVGMYWQVESIP